MGSLRFVIVGILSLAALAGCARERVSTDDEARARDALRPFKSELMGALSEGLAEGPEQAIAACRVQAPDIAARLSRDGIEMGRTSHKLRNPVNAPEPWVRPLLAHYVEDGTDKEPRAVVLADGRVGYVEPIYTKVLCLSCHGEVITPPVAERLAALYPQDRATGFRQGEFRGLFWVKMPRP